jgi:branched-chain amino acid transport system permease protein
VIAGVFVGILEILGAGYLDPLVGGGLGEVIPFAVLLIILLVKPYGLFGYARIERV